MTSRTNFRLRLTAYADIDRFAGEIRTAYITETAGQGVVYLEKRAEATLYVEAFGLVGASAVPGPHLAAEAAEVGQSPFQVAQMILSNANRWLGVVSPALEARRVGGKLRVRNATTAEDIVAEHQAAMTALQLIIADFPL